MPPPHTNVGCRKPPGLIKRDEAALAHCWSTTHRAKQELGTRTVPTAKTWFNFFSTSQTRA